MTQSYQATLKTRAPIWEKLTPLRTFLIVWFGQLVSIIGSGMTTFALGVYVFQQTGSATQFALMALFGMLPRVLLSPVAGVLADRWNRRKIMMVSNVGAMFSNLLVLLFLGQGPLALWQVYLATALNAGFSALLVPAYIASATLLVPKAHYGRVNGLVLLADALGQVVAPMLAGLLVSVIQIQGVILADLSTFIVAFMSLVWVKFPHPEAHGAGAKKGSLLAEAGTGWRYLTARPGLLGLLLFFVIGNFFVGNAAALLTPLILNFTTPQVLGRVLAVGGLGLLSGGITMSIWGGGRRRIYAVIGFYILLGVGILLTGLHPSAVMVAVGVFLAYLSLPFVIGASQAILQSKVAPEIQGRVFSLRIMLVTASFTLAYLTAGPLADWLFEPLLAVDGPLAGTIGSVLGSGPGRGIGLMFVVMGVLAVFTAIGALIYPRLRLVEAELPDAVED